jgi:stage V sporulation protein R
VRIVRKIAQYFYPQRQTQVMNEGWATFWHHALLNTLYDEGHLTDGVMIEWLKSHTNVIFQPPVGHPAYGGINPYALGFAMYTDLRRICEHPTDEDREWFPQLAGTPWLPALHHAMRNFKDESFIGQYLSPKVIRTCACSPSSTTSTTSTCASRRSTTPPATGMCARRCRASTTSARASPTSRC